MGLPYPNVLEKLNQFYNQNDCWMTYGKMVVWHGEEKLTWRHLKIQNIQAIYIIIMSIEKIYGEQVI